MTYQGQRRDGDGESVEFRDATTAVLVQTDAINRHGTAICHDLLARDEPTARNVLAIDFQQSADQWLKDWKDDVGTMPNDLRLIVMEDAHRSTAIGEADSEPSDHKISPIGNPQDLTALGIKITEAINEWETTGLEIAACLDSLSTMLQYTDFDPVFRFLHVFIRQLDSVGATGHFHIDPTAHDQQTITRLLQLFDAVITIEDGTVVSVQER